MNTIRFIGCSWWRLDEGRYYRPAMNPEGWREIEAKEVPADVRDRLATSSEIRGLDRATDGYQSGPLRLTRGGLRGGLRFASRWSVLVGATPEKVG